MQGSSLAVMPTKKRPSFISIHVIEKFALFIPEPCSEFCILGEVVIFSNGDYLRMAGHM